MNSESFLVFGAGSWGTALSIQLYKAGNKVFLTSFDETNLSKEATDTTLETESIETEEQEQQTKPEENKEPELETEAANTEESVLDTETDESAELDPPK